MRQMPASTSSMRPHRRGVTVTQVNMQVERLIGSDSLLSDVAVEGEVSNCKYNQSGHIYFTLKDRQSAISCVMFAGKRSLGLRFPMKDGDQVVVGGYVGVYAAAGRYQLYADSIELSGIGSLYKRFAELKRKLMAEGLFDSAHKKPLPSHAMRIGIVTAPTGAAVHDIIRVSRQRNPYVGLVLFPAVVQGDAAAASISRGIVTLDAMGLDVIIIGRGGGSIEDLWAFNEESVARAVFAARTPIVTAVGHETDVTIADFVADRRAATPSQAAELVTFVYDDFRNSIVCFSDRLERAMDHRLALAEKSLTDYKARLSALRPDKRLQVKIDRLTTLSQQLNTVMLTKLERFHSRLLAAAGRLEGLSPAKRLAGGFGFLTTADGKTVTSVNQLAVHDALSIRLRDGSVETTITKIDYNTLNQQLK